MYKKMFFSILFFITIIFFGLNSVYAIEQESNKLYEGIDVSAWQGYIDFSEVKNDGVEIVYIKASEGTALKDPYFELNYENAKGNGLNVGFYHFLTATNERRSKR